MEAAINTAADVSVNSRFMIFLLVVFAPTFVWAEIVQPWAIRRLSERRIGQSKPLSMLEIAV
jgi:hypothetical protein